VGLHRWFKENSQSQLEDPEDYAKALVDITEAADANNLILVSPTVRRGTGYRGNARWFAELVAACEARAACDIDRIQVLDLHFYRCNVDAWTGTDGILEETKADLISEIQTLANATRGPYQWYRWVTDRVFWVSEMSCESETNEGDPDESNVHSCQRQTQQFMDPDSGVNEHGEGSLKFMETEDRVRYKTLNLEPTHSHSVQSNLDTRKSRPFQRPAFPSKRSYNWPTPNPSGGASRMYF
tara:strand:+ start:3560 stop:4279 length:720 start_codon:yes stop_codon:yes gene_type:complete